MDSNRWWFTLAKCPDQTFDYQPNSDNNPYVFTMGLAGSPRPLLWR